MDEGRSDDAAKVVVAGIVEVTTEEIGSDLLGTVIAPAFEQGLLAALLFVAPVGRHERMHGPAKLAVVELGCLQTVEIVDVVGDAGSHSENRDGGSER